MKNVKIFYVPLMKSKNKFASELSERQMGELKALMNSDGNARTRKRAQAILLSSRGYTIDEISAITECHRVTISRWIDQWQERGLDGLLENEGRGRKKTLTEAEETQVLEWLKEEGRSVTRLLGKVEQSFGKKLSAATLKRLFKRAGKVWKRVRGRPAGQRDEEEFRQCEQELIEHMAAAVQGEIDLFYLDQSGFGRTPCIPYAWQDRGSVIAVPCRAGKRINVMGVYSLTKGMLQAEITDKNITSATVVGFLDKLSETIEKFTVVVLDNASIHTAKAVSDRLAEWENRGLYLYYLPTYSPELNLIWIVWRKVKYEWLPLRAFESFKSLWNALVDMIPKIVFEYNIYFA
jgi:transposase